jgi:hypothetical protein
LRRFERRKNVSPNLERAIAPAAKSPERPTGLRSFLLRRLTPALFFRVRHAAEESALEARDLSQVARRYWALWLDAAGALPLVRLQRILHGAAAALAVGAVAGMFVRGVFFEYAMVWRSTFVRDPDTVAVLLRFVLGPAAWLTGHPLPTADDAQRMFAPDGVPAAPWITLWAVTAALFVVVPRALLMLAATVRRGVLARRLDVSIDDDYYESLLAEVRRAEIERIEGAIDVDVTAAADRLVESIAGFVCERLYDARLVPKLRAFRDTGGSVEELERALAAECEAFQPELDDALEDARAVLETELRAAVERSVGLGLERAHAHDVALEAEDVPIGTFGGAIGREISNAVGVAVSTGVGLVVATVSGGFGHHLGAALLVTLLHTTGPVGFLIGGIGGLAMAVAGWYLGRDRIASGMRGVPLPRWVARIALRDRALAKLVADGRAQCHDAVRDKLGAEIAPLVPRLAEEIWASLRPALARAKIGARRTAR